ncbi:methyl-accepting chemotaxis protein [Ideonella sp. DXS29W]|uniref:Methyl-accepting chemotaxis protein n=1 Tax=Ideonella lacteola TaxID=2984193 RepID=A0ABU9BKH3_9BURK
MISLSHLRIGPRLGLGFTIAVLVTVSMALFARSEFQELSAQVKALAGQRMATVAVLAEVKDNLNVMARGARNIILIADEAGKKSEKQRIDESAKAIDGLFKRLNEMVTTETGRPLLQAVSAAALPYKEAMDQAVAFGMQGDDPAAISALLKQVRPVQATYFKAVDALVQHEQAEMTATAQHIDQMATQDGAWLLALAALGAAVGVVVGIGITQSIVRPLGDAVSLARTVARGDLSSRISPRGKDEVAELLYAMKSMNEGLVAVVAQVRQSSDSIATGSSQIATGTADLSQRTEEQASNLQQTAASMEQLAGTVRSSAETAREAHQLADDTVEAARHGGDAVALVVSTMREIAQSSQRIHDIIGVIDGIAFQTNILALNAAVEAARAGEQGRGFAVVAGEVRLLAQRSAEAAKEIKTLIGSSVERVDIGARQVDVAGQAMSSIVHRVERVGTLIREISNSAAEQSTGIGQVGEAVAQLDQVTQQNAALVEQSAAATESLREQASRLAETVRQFKLAVA